MFKKRKKGLPVKFILISFFLIILIGGLVYLNFHYKVRNINIEFFDQKSENAEIKTFTEIILRSRANNLFNFAILNDKNITKLVHDDYPIVADIEIAKNYKLDLNVNIKKNEEFFYTCVPEDLGFLVNCMIGNVDGIYYKEVSSVEPDEKKLSIEVNPKVLYNVDTSKQAENLDSLSGTRIYTSSDFLILREIINWMQKNAFVIKSVYIDELKVVSITTDHYTLKVNLEKGYADTVKDFELISRVGNLQKYINDEKEKIDYIDLSYKNKVFYKLKGQSEIETTSATTTATTTPIVN